MGLGIVILTVHVVNDPAVFYMQSEYNSQSLNSTIESPSIYMSCVSSSSLEDQAAFLQDMIDCLSIEASNGVPVTDKLCQPNSMREEPNKEGGTNVVDVVFER